MDKLRNLKERICSYDNLMAAYESAAEDKHYRPEVLIFSWDLEKNLLALKEDLENGTYEVGPYREFYVRYPKPRLVMALGFRDRVVQWAIYRQINPFVDKRFIAHSYGCREEKGSLAAALCLLNWVQLVSRKPDAGDWYIIKGDVSKFFYRVDHETIQSLYDDLIDDEWFHWLIGAIINNQNVPFGLPVGMKPDDCPRDQRLFDVGMPIGNLTSQETANIYLDKLDQFCKHTLKLRYYVRYMDDFCILVKGRKNAERILARIGDFLRESLKLDLSDKSRIKPATERIEFVGFDITPHGLRLRDKTVRHIKSVLRHLMWLYADGCISLDKALEKMQCYRGMTKHANAYYLLVWMEKNIVFQRGRKRHECTCEGSSWQGVLQHRV